jgi:CheY-like chemotaxis protein
MSPSKRKVPKPRRAAEPGEPAWQRSELGEFLATLTHELRNPLAPIRNAVQILQIKPGGDASAEVLGVIERQVQQLTHLIDDLLDVSRIVTDGLQLHRHRVDLGEVLRVAVESALPQIQANRHALVVTEPKRLVTLDADVTRLAQVVSNLLINAARYTPAGGRIRLTARREGADLVVIVRDNGAGIAPERLPRIFDLFAQGGAGARQSDHGLGVGLSLARKLAQMHGGDIAAQSAGPGKGAQFTVRVPVVAAASAAIRAPGLKLTPSATPLRVLVVDDNRASAVSLRTLLQLVGYRVQVAHDGAHALRVAREFEPDVILLDIGLPKLNGYEVARTLRQERGNGLKLIALTGFGQIADRERSRAAGFDHHLVKPVQTSDLLRLLERRAEKSGNGHDPAGHGPWHAQERVQVLALPLTR